MIFSIHLILEVKDKRQKKNTPKLSVQTEESCNAFPPLLYLTLRIRVKCQKMSYFYKISQLHFLYPRNKTSTLTDVCGCYVSKNMTNTLVKLISSERRHSTTKGKDFSRTIKNNKVGQRAREWEPSLEKASPCPSMGTAIKSPATTRDRCPLQEKFLGDLWPK